jgi:hypothetical protein
MYSTKIAPTTKASAIHWENFFAFEWQLTDQANPKPDHPQSASPRHSIPKWNALIVVSLKQKTLAQILCGPLPARGDVLWLDLRQVSKESWRTQGWPQILSGLLLAPIRS